MRLLLHLIPQGNPHATDRVAGLWDLADIQRGYNRFLARYGRAKSGVARLRLQLPRSGTGRIAAEPSPGTGLIAGGAAGNYGAVAVIPQRETAGAITTTERRCVQGATPGGTSSFC